VHLKSTIYSVSIFVRLKFKIMRTDYEYICIYIYMYIFMSNEHNMGSNHSIKTSNQSIENMLKFRYLGMALKHENCRKDITKIG